MLHAGELFGASRQIGAAARLPGAVAAFRSAPSVTTAFQVGGRLVGVIGTERVVGALVKFGVDLALRGRALDQGAAERMATLMRARVPQDTGALLNSITYRFEGNLALVEAGGLRTGRGGDETYYGRFVEFGTRPGVRGRRVDYVADDGFYSGASRPTRRVRSVYRTHPGTPAQPFFFNSAEEVLGDRHAQAQRAASDQTPQELR